MNKLTVNPTNNLEINNVVEIRNVSKGIWNRKDIAQGYHISCISPLIIFYFYFSGHFCCNTSEMLKYAAKKKECASPRN